MILASRLQALLRNARLKSRDDWEMAINRFVAAITVLLITSLTSESSEGYRLTLVAVLLYGLAGIIVALHILAAPGPSKRRRLFALAADLGAVSYQLHVGGSSAAWLYPGYLWVIFGNGARFGPNYLLLAMTAGSLSFAAVVFNTAFWRSQPLLSGGLFLGQVIVPMYAFALIRRLSEARRQAEQASRAKSLFLASVSHELRTPLNAIIGMGALLENGRLAPEQRDMSRTILTAARTLLASIDGILDLSRIEAGKMPEVKADFSLTELLAHLRKMIRAQTEAKSLYLGVFVSSRTPLLLHGDDRRLKEILLNLLGNAIKFTETGGITVTVDLVAHKGSIARLRFEVADTGIGVEPAARDRIFESFVQANQSISERFGGTGLGLAISRKAVQLLGGEIGVLDSPGGGSTFWFELDFPWRPRPALDGRAFSGIHAQLLTRQPDVVAPTIGKLTELGLQVEMADPEAEGPVLALLARKPLAGLLSFAEPGSVAGAEPGAWPVSIALCDSASRELPDAETRRRVLTALPLSADHDDLLTALDLVRSRLALPGAERADSVALPRSKRRLRILIAEDNEINCRVIGKILEAAGHTLAFAGDGESALDLLIQQEFDLAVVDVNMPLMNGIELAQHYRLLALGQNAVPIIALTADITPETKKNCLDAGMQACLTKPIEPALLVSTIDSLAEAAGRQSASAGASHPNVAEISTHPRFRSAAPAAVDRKVIDSLANLGGNDFVHELAVDFVSGARVMLDAMRTAARHGDVPEFRSQAHSMRSSAANFGALELCRLCLPWQTIAADDLALRGDAYLEGLDAEIDRVEAALSHWREEQSARQ
ncbi:MAG: response regulator [Acetobacteraceae bacterium]|nr:response regulator [Acetobacteraceae bacterium]